MPVRVAGGAGGNLLPMPLRAAWLRQLSGAPAERSLAGSLVAAIGASVGPDCHAKYLILLVPTHRFELWAY